jgi:hypothetical protein
MRWWPAVSAVLRRPRLWPAGARAYVVHVPRRWYRHAPFLPVPDRAWMRFRLQTAYGDPDHAPDPEDVVTWLEWSRSWRALPSARP